MAHSTTKHHFEKDTETWSVLEKTLPEGARRMLQQALEYEIEEYLEKYASHTDEKGRRLIVKNGYHPPERLLLAWGPLL